MSRRAPISAVALTISSWRLGEDSLQPGSMAHSVGDFAIALADDTLQVDGMGSSVRDFAVALADDTCKSAIWEAAWRLPDRARRRHSAGRRPEKQHSRVPVTRCHDGLQAVDHARRARDVFFACRNDCPQLRFVRAQQLNLGLRLGGLAVEATAVAAARRHIASGVLRCRHFSYSRARVAWAVADSEKTSLC